ncbi:Retinol dehydrogenase 12 [Lasiodiplodia theobromae]|uniref:Retinol dehydrogenase 12 n=1 Tax=Lasiodiplodia theobromae TaxID=45133 RepID=A0A5N5D5R8_9PEZI|nr:Retinol dehydrogenase 12 [Lasiodiplodia theobromae]
MASHAEFGHDTKATEVADAFPSQIKGRVVLITGVSRGGIGGAAALAFARHSPSLLILVSRTQSKIDEVVSDIRAIDPSVSVKTVLVDLTSQASVRAAAEKIQALTPRIDLLVNNAGMYVSKRGYSPEGIERQLAANHVGPFLLTNLLRPQLLAAAKDAPAGATRIVNVSSEGHRMQPFRFSDYNGEKVNQEELPEEERINPAMKDHLPPFILEPEEGYVAFMAYGQSKTANVLFTVGLNERFKGTGVVSYALHPGTIFTEVLRDTAHQKDNVDAMMNGLNPKASVDEGAATTLVAAIDPALNKLNESIFLDDCQINKAEPYATDPKIADRLWKLSEELVKQTF